MIRLPRLSVDPTAFPAIETALEEPDGLLAFGGDLGSERLLAAYAQGIVVAEGKGDVQAAREMRVFARRLQQQLRATGG